MTNITSPDAHGDASDGKQFDVITIGRASVDLYGTQIGGRLEDMGSFQKYIGGSPTNIACGAARLGLRTGLISRVGDEHMGRFILEQLARESVDTRGISIDTERLTAIVLLGIRDQTQFPILFYRENCADMALSEGDIDVDYIASARCLVATGTHLSHPMTAAAVLKALTAARGHGVKVALDIDYRPNLWGVASHGMGEMRYIESNTVTQTLQATLHHFDLIVGTEEEFHIAGGVANTVEALRAVRRFTDAVLVCKRGPMGSVAFTDAIPDVLEDGDTGSSFQIEVFNVLGAGDGFMAGLLRAWLDGVKWNTALTWANACGALAVSRHGCTPAYPSLAELRFFLDRGVTRRDLRHDRVLEQKHWATTRSGDWPTLRIFAFDHRAQLEQMPGATDDAIGRFKLLCLDAAEQVAAGRPGYGMLCDDRLGKDTLYRTAGTSLWIGRPVELPGSRPLAFEPGLGVDLGGLGEWPRDHVVKCLCFAHPDDSEELWSAQLDNVRRVFGAARRNNLEFLLEVIPSRVAPIDDDSTAQVIQRVYSQEIFPDWWKLEPFATRSAGAKTVAAIERNDPDTRGILMLGLDALEQELLEGFELASEQKLVKGFAVGRTIFGDTARAWFTGTISDDDAVRTMAASYRRLCGAWDSAQTARQGE